MKKLTQLTTVALSCCLLIVGTADAFKERTIPTKPDKASIGSGYDRGHVEVKFIDEMDIGLSADNTPIDRGNRALKSAPAQSAIKTIADAGGSWKRMVSLPEEEMDDLVNNAEKNLDRDIADLNNYFILTVPDGIRTEEWLDQLNSLAEVEIAVAMPLPAPLPVLPPNYQSNQGYLNNATTGIGASTAWATTGGTGWPPAAGPIRIVDFEYSWNLNHLDLPSVWYTYNPSYTPSDPFSDDNHGTAVLGEMASMNNGLGTVGAVYASSMAVSPTYLNGAWQLGVAMTWMLSATSAGDVWLIEQQMQGPNYTGSPPGTQDGLIPVEWWLSWYNIIVTAVGNGIHVVEAAGNGREDLDNPVYSTLNGGHWPFLPANNSGAIIVGAGAAPGAFGGSDVDRSRLWFSNWGSRVNLQGWGERVYTTGYGNLYSADGKNYWYTHDFSGTSSASPIVASAVAIIEGVNQQASAGVPISPATMRSLLVSTGSPQQAGTYPVSQNIGPRPDVNAALANMTCCANRGDVDNSGGGTPVDIGDLVYLVDFMFSGGPAPPCFDEGDVDGSGTPPIDIADLVYLVDYMFNSGPAPPSC
ncbi:MAG: S8 family serine peptidase [candidate division Zixibacteria bacterium]|nr:S8 family serine peptidase [candidate division Zixibacteria bacterium]MDH3938900.1 S8 family serine peptidase [candidate division Zixibacteria bacterium]